MNLNQDVRNKSPDCFLDDLQLKNWPWTEENKEHHGIEMVIKISHNSIYDTIIIITPDYSELENKPFLFPIQQHQLTKL